ncbi:sulfotransferase [Aquabacter spiritensis]|uniref:sulfotransferase n=1 Tax=Aquabacter spiritensis TaxID=933073 RepID=UPI001A9FB21E|nr:sulfotransferase [Aquabacter spiritensis]
MADAGASDRPEALPSLFEQCRDLMREIEAQERPPVRTIHHLACTGGTLISRCIAAQPNVQVLSEVDPLSPMRQQQSFVPSDLIALAQRGSRPPDADVLVKIFLSGLSVLYEDARGRGHDLVLRDHSHSHFSYGPALPARSSLRDIVVEAFPVRSVLTVRHPFDSFLSLKNNGWLHFSPQTLHEYAVRYHAFLDHYQGLECVRYEDFVADPAGQMQRICSVLALAYDSDFLHTFSAIKLSGDSGRKGSFIAPRARRSHRDELAQEAAASDAFGALLGRLGYELGT